MAGADPDVEFYDRSGCLRPVEQVSPATYRAIISDDEAALASMG